MRLAGLAAMVVATGLRPDVALAPERAEPILSVRVLPSGGSPPAAPVTAEAMALAVAGQAPEELLRLLAVLRHAREEAVRQADPLLASLDEGGSPPAFDLSGSLRELPAITAGHNLASTVSESGGLRVTLGDRCAEGSDLCAPVFGPPSDEPLARRARAQVWALSHAAIIRVTGDRRADLLRRLRQAQDDGKVALVFDESQGRFDADQVHALAREARRALGHVQLGTREERWLRVLSQMPDHWALPLTLGPSEVLVVPRLSSLARMAEFVSDLEQAGPIEWVVRPPDNSARAPAS